MLREAWLLLGSNHADLDELLAAEATRRLNTVTDELARLEIEAREQKA